VIKDAYGNPRFYGVYRGVVRGTSDPLNKGRLKIQVPQVLATAVTEWAWPIASVSNAAVSVPNVGDGVFVMFEGGDPSYPLWSGLFSGETLATPVVPADTPFTVLGGTLGTQPTFSSSPLFTGSYLRTNDLVHFRIDVDMDNITNFGTGQYYLDLPFPSKYNYKFRDGCLHDISASKDYAIGGHVAAGASRLYLFSTDTQSSHVFDIDFDHNSPVTLAAADNFHIAGTYIAQ
jgi:hypothetical protein